MANIKYTEKKVNVMAYEIDAHIVRLNNVIAAIEHEKQEYALETKNSLKNLNLDNIVIYARTLEEYAKRLAEDMAYSKRFAK